ncbi:MAG: hypothetical protein JSV62_14535 [Promethearchaeota archaeon]|nr:MAG: hypothetical protein JSV62_14535 [Candidatus Lokiarchaeota archaeon]
MGFGKAFVFSILAFVGLNFVFTIIYYAIGPGFNSLFTTIQTSPLMILYYLFGSIIAAPSTILDWVIAQPFLLSINDNLVLGLGYLAALIIAAILAGRFGDNKGQCFGGWFLTVFISTILVILGAFIDPTFQSTLLTLYGWPTFDVLLIYAIIFAVINIIFYGFFALLLSKTEYY